MRLLSVVLLVLAAATAAAASGPAASAASGGTPIALRSGGAAFRAPLLLPDRRPIAQLLAPSQREITSGDASPAIRVHVRQRGTTRVRAWIVVLRLPANRPVGRISIGLLRTGRRVSIRLPRTLELSTGRYLVRLHVKDPRGRTLRRSGAFPGRTRIVVRRPPKAAVAPVPAPAPAPALGAPLPGPGASPGGPGVFPVAGPFHFGAGDARFGAPRARHTHQGQDIMAAAGTPIVAPYAGTVSSTSFQSGGAGEYVVLDAVDGRDYFFAHCLRGSTVVVPGAAVSPGQALCQVGATGATSGTPHLHFEIWQVGWRVAGGVPIDPLPELQAWAGR